MKKITVTLITTLLLAVCALSAFAGAPPIENHVSIQPRFTYLSYAYCRLGIDSSGKATCTANAMTSDGTYTTAYMELKQNINGSWATIATWSGGSAPNIALALTGQYYVPSGYWYYATATIDVYDAATGNYLEQAVAYSNTVYH